MADDELEESDAGNLTIPANAMTQQFDAPSDLKLVSWPPSLYLPTPPVLLHLPYVYQSFPRDLKRAVNLFVIDRGVNIQNVVS